MTKRIRTGMTCVERTLRELSRSRWVYSYQWRSETGSRQVLSIEGKSHETGKLERVEGNFSEKLLSQCSSPANVITQSEVKQCLSHLLAYFETKDATPTTVSGSTKDDEPRNL